MVSLLQSIHKGFIQRMDFFGFTPKPRHATVDRHATNISSFFTILVLFLLSLYGTNLIFRWRTEPPQQVLQHVLPPTDFNHSFYSLGMKVSHKGKAIDDVSILSITFEVIEMGNNYTSSFPLGMKLCRLRSSDDGATSVQEFFCPERAGIINSGINVNVKRFIRGSVKACNPRVGSKDSNAKMLKPCLPREQIEDIVKKSSLDLFVAEDSFTQGEPSKRWRHYDGYMTIGMRKGFAVFVRKWEVYETPDFLLRYSTNEFVGAKSIFYDSFVKDLDQDEEDLLFTLDIWLDPTYIKEGRLSKTIFDIFGQVGALMNVCIAAFSIVFWRYNRQEFFKSHPFWDRLNDDFEYEEKVKSDEQILEEKIMKAWNEDPLEGNETVKSFREKTT